MLFRSALETTTEIPALKPERMVSWIYTPKNIAVTEVNRDLRILVSKDGEMSVYAPKNSMIFTDWSSNLQRIADLMKNLDTPNSPQIQKIVDASEKKAQARRALKAKETETK